MIYKCRESSQHLHRDSFACWEDRQYHFCFARNWWNTPENCSIGLHRLLHLQPYIGSGLGAIRISDLVQVFYALEASFLRNNFMRLSGSQSLFDVMSTRATEDNKIQEGVCTKTVGTVNGHASSLTGSIKTRDNIVLAILIMAYEQNADV